MTYCELTSNPGKDERFAIHDLQAEDLRLISRALDLYSIGQNSSILTRSTLIHQALNEVLEPVTT